MNGKELLRYFHPFDLYGCLFSHYPLGTMIDKYNLTVEQTEVLKFLIADMLSLSEDVEFELSFQWFVYNLENRIIRFLHNSKDDFLLNKEIERGNAYIEKIKNSESENHKKFITIQYNQYN